MDPCAYCDFLETDKCSECIAIIGQRAIARIAELEADNNRLIELLTRYHNEDHSSFYGAKQTTIMEVREAIASGKDGDA